MVDLAQAQERVEFLRMKYCALLKENEQLRGPELRTVCLYVSLWTVDMCVCVHACDVAC